MNSDSTNLVGMKCMPCEKYAKADMPVRLSGAMANVPYHLVRLLYYFGRAHELLFRYYPCTRLMGLDQSPWQLMRWRR